jgi:hypothetical protein
VSFLWSASGSGEESGRGTERGTSSEAGEWQRYDFISVSVYCLVILLVECCIL